MRDDCLDLVPGVLRANARSAINALSGLATQCLPLHQPVGVIGPMGHLLANSTATPAKAYPRSTAGSMGVAP
jgi:hypothetical protein